ncbi:MAG TPA: hypothetical protein VM223_19445, partial [Planctomycetota bacterium]|nr:hypothetical protein [Planctomycetota bacterium]
RVRRATLVLMPRVARIVISGNEHPVSRSDPRRRLLDLHSTLSKLEALLNKRLRPLRGGRPPQRAGGERQGQLVRQGQGEEDKGQN